MHKTGHAHIIHPKYRPDIDGLRALAIISVLVFHGFPNLLPGGFIGVDIFFVISGFLISSIIFSSLEQQRFSYFDFYVRRIRRIFPALLVVIVASLIFGWFVLFSDEFEALGKHIAAGATFISNFILWRESGYFDQQAESKVLLHLWSLAVEEQFYIFWPILLALAWKHKLGFLKITLTIGILSFLANLYLLEQHPVAAFFLPFARFWELMLGGILAFVKIHRPNITSPYPNLQSFAGFILIISGLCFITKSSNFPGYWALLPSVGSVLVISAGTNAWFNQRLLANSPMVWVGLISYPLYLWHWPLLSFAYVVTAGKDTTVAKIILLAISVLLAWLTYKVLEQPIRSGKYKKKSVPVLITSMVVILGVGLLLEAGKISPRINSKPIQELINARNDWNTEEGFSRIHYQREIFRRADGGTPNTTVILGDSHAIQYLPRAAFLLRRDKTSMNSIYFATHEGCLPIPGMFKNQERNRTCNDYRASIRKVLSDGNISTVVLAACWSCYLVPHPGDTDRPEYASHGNLKIRAEELLSSFLVNTSKTKTVYLLLDNPIGDDFDPSSYAKLDRFSDSKFSRIPARVPVAQDQLKLRDELENIAQSAGAKVIDPFKALCDKNYKCIATVNGLPIYKDGNHLRAHFVSQQASYIDGTLMAH